ncbi:hypothetical protein M408DRAFT_316562 [Serendipita vermifera MAFF 305830]|uniref:Uncharacterized protein n=1 Tax=Serendipita vermifera MAFF 305830 TaxID=933852 RepID=A0A0C2WF44_SERVB|nr:hypothetical protein M408DRAFT_316562 [Serendipita vermifera MAFF 305830]
MLWLRPLYPEVRDWDELKQVSGLQPGHFDLDLPMLRLWIDGAKVVPDLLEILCHIGTAQSLDRNIGPIWRIPGDNPYFMEALCVLDHLICQQPTSDQHHMMISLICQDLELEPSPDFADYFNTERLQAITELEDPCLRLFTSALAGLSNTIYHVSFIDFLTPRNKLWTRIAEYLLFRYRSTTSSAMLQLKASIWPKFTITNDDLILRASRDPELLCRNQLSHIAIMAKGSQSGFLSLLWDLSTKVLRTRCSPEHLATFLTCINQAMNLSSDSRATYIMRPLAGRVLHMLDAMLSDNDYDPIEQDIISKESNRVWKLMMNELASRTVFGGCNSRILHRFNVIDFKETTLNPG